MIVDDLVNFKRYIPLNEKFKKVAEVLGGINVLKQGSHEIDGREIYVNIDEYTTKNITDSKPEAHRNYIDIQIVISGHEKIGYTNIKNGNTAIEYNEQKDIEFLNADCEYLKAEEGRFFIFFPDDIHHPCITDGEKSEIKKAVFKIKI